MLKSLTTYGLMSIYQAILSFTIISYFSFRMETKIFGEYTLYLALIPFAINILMLGVSNSIAVFYHNVGAERYRVYLGQIIYYFLPTSFILAIIISLTFSGFLAQYFFLKEITVHLVFLLTSLQLLPLIIITYFQATQNPNSYAWFNASLLTSIFGATIISYEIFEDLGIIFFSMSLVNFIFTILALVLLYKKTKFKKRFDLAATTEICKYSLPLVVHTAGTTLLFMSDRFFISYFFGNEQVSFYAVSIQLSMIILIAVNAFTGAWGPFVLRQLKQNNLIFNWNNTRKIYVAILFFLALPLLLYFIQKSILNWFFDVRYKEAMQYVLIIGMGYSMMGIYRIFIGFLHYLKKSNLISALTISTLALNLLLNYLFIIKWGPIGVAYSTLISMFVLSIVTIYFVNKYCFIKWSKK